MPVAATAPWKITGRAVTVSTRGVEARLDLDAPAAGLAVPGADGGFDHLLGVDLRAPSAAPADHWIRGADLTAVYEPDDPRRLRATAMWRVHPGPLAAWELVVSAQTALLHAAAALAVVSEFGADDAWWASPAVPGWRPLRRAGQLPAEAAFVLARRGATGTVVAVHPQDERRIALTLAAGRARVEGEVFASAIEKGVILRSRALAAVGPAAGAEEWAAELCTTFAASPPFLDT